MDLSNHVIMPRADFAEMSEAAYYQTPTSALRSTVEFIKFISSLILIVASCKVGMDFWKETATEIDDKRHANKMAELDHPANQK